jgi:two-component system phosphate regulon response regulator OmpR
MFISSSYPFVILGLMTDKLVLLIEDEQAIREVERAYLEQAGFRVMEADNGKTGLAMALATRFDLIVLDLNLPQLGGLEICRQLRQGGSLVPIVMLTAKTEEVDELIGLEAGADDYIKKPFQPQVLIARVQALVRRWGHKTLHIGPLTIDQATQAVTKNGQALRLTTTQFNILNALASQPNHVFSREQLISQAYNEGMDRDIFDRTIDAHIKSVRKIIEDNAAHPRMIMTVIGRGYTFED